MYRNERFKNNYDFLRVFAAVCIMFSHSFSLLNMKDAEPIRNLTEKKIDFSFIGLCIFFSISGYLIAKSAVLSSSFKNYLWKRFLRIQPLLIFTCILTVLVIGPIFTQFSLKNYLCQWGTWSYFKNILPLFGLQFTLPGVFVHNVAEAGVNGSLWTLIIEERLYLFIGILFLLRKEHSNYFLIFITFLNILYVGNLLFFNSELIPYLDGPAFFYGIIFLNSAVVYLLGINLNKNKNIYIIISVILIIVGLIFPALKFIPVFSIPIFVNSIAQIRGILNKTGRFGDFTYGIYVFSFPVQQMLISANIARTPYLLFFVTTIIVLLLAILSWHMIEKKFLKLKNRVK